MMGAHSVNSPIPINNVVALHLLVHERVWEAAETLRYLPNPDRRALASGSKSSWPVYVREWTAYGNDITRVPKVPPTNGAIDRMNQTIGWIAWLATQDQSEAVIVWFSFGARTRTNTLARRLRVSRETIRRKRKAGVERLVRRYGAQLTGA